MTICVKCEHFYTVPENYDPFWNLKPQPKCGEKEKCTDPLTGDVYHKKINPELFNMGDCPYFKEAYEPKAYTHLPQRNVRYKDEVLNKLNRVIALQS